MKIFRSVFWTGAALLTAFVGCSSDPEGNDCSGDDCDEVSCQSDDDCTGVSYCGADDLCTTACDTADDCTNGGTCNDDGKCVSGGGGGNGGGGIGLGGGGNMGSGASDGMGGANACVDVTVEFEPEVPTITLLIDRSGSMNSTGFGGVTRWAGVTEALVGASDGDSGVVGEFQDQVRFGVTLYSVEDRDSGQCPLLVQDSADLSNYDDIAQAMKNVPDGGTPTQVSFESTAAALAADPFEGPKVIVLATDGQPDTCDDGSTSPSVKKGVVDAVEDVYQKDGITTFVVNVANGVDFEHQREVANVGQGFDRTDETVRYFSSASPEDFESALRTIINGERSCVFELDGEIPSGQESKGTVTLDGNELTLNGDDGWQVNGPSELELLGSSCQKIKSGDRDLSIVFPCGVIKPAIK